MIDFDVEKYETELMIDCIRIEIDKIALGKRTAEALAKALYTGLKEFCRATGYPDTEPRLTKPFEESYDGAGDRWLVTFEGGPYQWCHPISNAFADHGLMEPYYSFDLSLYTQEDYK